MPRKPLARDTKKLQGTIEPKRERQRAVADPAEYQRIFAATLARWDEAQRQLDATHPDDWARAPAQLVLDRTASLLIRLGPLLNFAVVVPQRPADAAEPSNPWTVLRGGKAG